MKRTLTVAMAVTLACGAARAAGTNEAAPPPRMAPEARELLIQGATLWTVAPAGIIEKGDLLVRDGRIVAVGGHLDVPSGALVIDAAGKHVTPGLIDAHSHTAVEGPVNEGTNNITAEVRIGDVLDPDDIAIYRELAGGLTTANVLHGSANSIGGQNQVIKLKWGVTAEDLKFPGAPPGIKFALGENPKRSNFNAGDREPRYPLTRMGVEESIRERFLATKQYTRDWARYEKLKPREQEREVPPRRDLQLEAIEQILRGQRLVHSHCYRQDEILMLIRLADELGFKIATFQHVLEGYKVADEIARHGAGGSTFSDWWAYKIEAWDAIPFNGALMTQRGVVVSFNSDSNELARRMNFEAAKAMKYGGMPELEAIKLVTINPARQLGIDKRVGSLEAGKDADFVIWSGHPMSVYTRAEQTWVDGTRQFDLSADLASRAEIEKRREELIGKLRGTVSAAKPADEPPARPVPPAVTPVWRDRMSSTSGVYAIVGATVHTVTGGDIDNAIVVIKEGQIAAMGRDVAIPGNAVIVKSSGQHLYPGMIDADTVLGLTEIGSVAGSVDTTEAGKINPNVHVELAVNPESELIPVTRANGVTHVLTAPRGGLIAGTSALLRLDGWTWEDLTAGAPLTMTINYPAYPGAVGRRGGFRPQVPEEDQKKRRESDLNEIKATLEAARGYALLKAAGSPSLKPDTVLEAMLPVLDGRVPVMVYATEIRQIKDAIAWARHEGFRMILAGGGDAWRVADQLKAADIPVVVGPVLSDGFRRDEPYDTAYSLPEKLRQAGVRFCISNGGGGFGASNTRNLPYQAGMAAAFGLPRDVALKAVTLYPAQILGVGNRLGSIEVGKSASLMLTDGDPLEIKTRVLRVFIDGREVDLGNKHQRLYDKYRARPMPATAAR